MDIVSHALWAGAAGIWLKRRKAGIRGRTVAAIVVFGVAPDVIPVLPVLATSVAQSAPLAFLYAHVGAMPGAEPPMPALARALSDHLHCVMHSVIIAGAVSALVWWKRRGLLPLFVGWWLHIALDVPTHSEDYYPVPLFYPVTQWGVDGIAWTNPWVLAVNYAAIAGAYALLFQRRSRRVGSMP